jgi:hypothetical protein
MHLHGKPEASSARRLPSFSTSGSLSPAAHVTATSPLLFDSIGHIKCMSLWSEECLAQGKLLNYYYEIKPLTEDENYKAPNIKR